MFCETAPPEAPPGALLKDAVSARRWMGVCVSLQRLKPILALLVVLAGPCLGLGGRLQASFALAPECIHNLLKRNLELARTNLAILEKFIDSHRWACEWVKPKAGTTAFVRFTKMGKPINDVVFCETLQEKSGVMFVPGSRCFGGGEEFQGYVRIGYVCETEVLEKGLEALRTFMEDEYEDVPSLKKTKSAQ